MNGVRRHIAIPFLLLITGLSAPLTARQADGSLQPAAVETNPPADSLQKKDAAPYGMSPEEAIDILSRQGGDTLTAKELRRLERYRKKEAKKHAKELKKQEKLRKEVEEYFTHVVIDTTHKQVKIDTTAQNDPLLAELTIPGMDKYVRDDSTMIAEAVMLQKPPAPKVKSASHAAFLSALVPGLGQIYGGSQWWMAPVFWGGMTGTLMAVSYYNGYYNDFRKEYKHRILTGEVNDYEYFDNNTLVDRMQYAEQQRDLWIIGTVGVYLLNVLHANVAVQLSEFRVQRKHRKMLELQNLFEQQAAMPPTLSFSPSMIHPNMGVNHYPTPGIRLALDF